MYHSPWFIHSFVFHRIALHFVPCLVCIVLLYSALLFVFDFYRAAWNATRSYDEVSVRPSVCPSVRPSVWQTRALWQNGRKLCLDIYTTRKIIYPSFLRKKMFGGGRPLLPEILGQPVRVGAKSPILNLRRYERLSVQNQRFRSNAGRLTQNFR